jgi:hypothetical protein
MEMKIMKKTKIVSILMICCVLSGICGIIMDVNGASHATYQCKSVVRLVGNNPPKIPQTPIGPTGGGIIFNRVVVGNSYTYTTTTTDPEGSDISYQWNWGDGSISSWSPTWPSGAYVEESYIWATPGTYEVRVKARDDPNGDGDPVDGLEGGWSDPLTVTVSNKLSDATQSEVLMIDDHSNALFLLKTCHYGAT